MTALAPVMEGFFTERLIGQRRASRHTIASYRDTFRLLLAFVHDRTGTSPSRLAIEDLDATVIAAFLVHLETGRHNSIRTRNNRLAAIHSIYSYAALRVPEHADVIARVLAIPAKRTDRPLVCFLTDNETDALLAAPDPTTRTDGETTLCSLSRSKPGFESPNSPPCAGPILNSAPEHTFDATAKDAKNASPHSPPRPPPCSPVGTPRPERTPMIRSSPADDNTTVSAPTG